MNLQQIIDNPSLLKLPVYMVLNAIAGIFFAIAALNFEFNLVDVVLYIISLYFFYNVNKFRLEMQEAKRQKIAAERAVAEQQRERERREQRTRQKQSYGQALERFKKYGWCIKKIIFGGEYDIYKQVLVYESIEDIEDDDDDKVIIINGSPIHSREIISFRVEDDPDIVKGHTTYRTTTDTGDLFNRGLQGYMLDGDRGMEIGAETAARDTEAFPEDDAVFHRYKIYVTLNSGFRKCINVGFHDNAAEDLRTLFTDIIDANRAKQLSSSKDSDKK